MLFIFLFHSVRVGIDYLNIQAIMNVFPRYTSHKIILTLYLVGNVSLKIRSFYCDIFLKTKMIGDIFGIVSINAHINNILSVLPSIGHWSKLQPANVWLP